MIALIDKIAEGVLNELEEDYVGIWSIVKEIRCHIKEDSLVLDTTLGVVKKILESGNVFAGKFYDETFRGIDAPIDVVLSKIVRDWKELGRDPDIGEIIWFADKN